MAPIVSHIEPGSFKLSGDLTFTSVPEVWDLARKMLLDVYEENVEIDIGSVEKFDSSGLALLVAWARWAHCNNKELKYRNVTEKTKDLLKTN